MPSHRSKGDRINYDAVKWLAHKLPRMLKVGWSSFEWLNGCGLGRLYQVLRVDLSDTQVDDAAAMLLMQRLPSPLQGPTFSSL